MRRIFLIGYRTTLVIIIKLIFYEHLFCKMYKK